MRPVPTFNPALLKKVDEVGFSERSVQVLKNDGNILYIGELVWRTEIELLRMPHLGRNTLYDIKKVLAGMGLHLGMEVPNWPPVNLELHE
jgi:DNA-directed RNA polymerase subunit alpha